MTEKKEAPSDTSSKSSDMAGRELIFAPWHDEPSEGLDDVGGQYRAIVNENGGLVGYAHEHDVDLVCAAPDLLEACKRMLAQTKALSRVIDPEQRKALMAAERAIKKAEGKE